MIYATALAGDHEELREKCVGTEKLARNCPHGMLKEWCAVCSPTPACVFNDVIDMLGDCCVICGTEIEQPTRGRKRTYCEFCSNGGHGARNREQYFRNRLNEVAENVASSHLRAFKYMSFDGRYEGPTNLCFQVVTALKFDRGYKPMPIDVHVKPAHFPQTMYTALDDHEHVLRQKPLRDGLARPKTNHCPHCSTEREELVLVMKKEVVWETTFLHKEKKVRTHTEDRVLYETTTKLTKGRYVLQGHVCTHV